LDLLALVSAPKKLSHCPQWAKDGRGGYGRRCPLSVVGFENAEVFVRITTTNRANLHGSMVQLEVDDPKGSCIKLTRVDWKVDHTNSRRHPVELGNMVKEIDSTHIHTFRLNFDFGENRFFGSNLPFAEVVAPDPASYIDFIEFCGQELKIEGLTVVGFPPQQWDLPNDVSLGD